MTATVRSIEDFALERYFARWEFAVRHQLSASDVEPFTLSEVVALADAESSRLWDSLSLGYTETAAIIALRAGEQVLNRSRTIVSSNLGCAREFFAMRQDELGWVPAKSGKCGLSSIHEAQRR